MNKPETIVTAPEPVVFGNEAYVSPEFAAAEREHLWPRVWQHACRLEEIPEVGDYVTYDIADDSILVVRAAPDRIVAFWNVCVHRGKRLAQGCGSVREFRCSYHAWRYDLEGKCTFVLNPEDWGDRLDDARLTIPQIQVDTWGGWVWINMDPEAGPLREYLEPAAALLDPFELEKMRYRWRMWTQFDCNWKVAIEAFIEAYHVEGTHPQLMQTGDFHMWSRAKGLHAHNGFDELDPEKKKIAEANTINRPGKGDDVRVSTAKLQREIWDTTNTRTTLTLVEAAERLPHELPEGTPVAQVMAHWLRSAKADDAARGVIWPDVSPAEQAAAGSAWHIFPNMTIGHSITNALLYRVRPLGREAERCIFEAAVIELFPPDAVPETEWLHVPHTDKDKWPPVLLQDFDNMSEVQKGMKSRGFAGCIPSPRQEQTVANLHRNLARYVGMGSPEAL